ncbi:MAG: hypothetical protein AB7H88_22410, partial [Vicinamibacterales bacterium]
MMNHGHYLGLLVVDALALGRGERLGVPSRQPPLPHHQECPACGFARWDGYSDHPWAGVRFARRTCTGRVPDAADDGGTRRAAVGVPSPMAEEIRALARDPAGNLIEGSGVP